MRSFNRLSDWRGQLKKSYRIIFVSFLMVLFVWLYMFRKPYDGEGFILSDATYHVLLTMEAYEETPVYVHRYLPIQSLGGEYNKGIVNGSSIIMDDVGNNYYVSFSSLGFLAPYLFCKLLRLGLTIDSLYLFNSVIMFLCAIITAAIVYSLFHNEIIAYTGAVIYLFMPEIMYTQGIVYWHHSLSQLFLGIQLLLFVMLYVNNVHKCRLLMKIVFYVVAFLYAYNEWTGYVSNVGVALGIIILNGIVTKLSLIHI